MTGDSPLSSTALLVLGMHRSGTSAVAGTLSRLGVEFGSDLLPPARDNPKGFFEHAEIVQLHDEVLSLFDATWDDPRSLPERWEHDPRLAPPRRRLEDILRRAFAGATLWGVKDPRLCRLLPFWTPVLRGLDISAKALLVLRDPAETSASLRQRDGMMPEHASTLWLSHVLVSELSTRGMPRAVLLYEDLLRDWPFEMRRVSDILGVDLFAFSDSIRHDVAEFLEPELRNHRDPDMPTPRAPQNRWAGRVYDAMVQWRREATSPTLLFDQASEALAAGELAAEPIAAHLRARLARAAAAAASRAERALSENAEAARADAAALRRELDARASEVAALRREADARATQVAASQNAATSARVALAAQTRKLANYGRWLSEATGDAKRHRADLARAVAEAEENTVQLAKEAQKLQAAYDHVVGSMSWRVTSPVRRLFMRYPRALRRLKSLVRLACWALTFRYAKIAATVRERARLRHAEGLLAGNPLFDADFYLRSNPDAALSGRSPLWHYLVRGHWQGLRPHPLFDPEWYLRQNPDVTRAGIDPLVHFAEVGIAQNRNPNPFFDLAWYGRRNPDAALSGLDPLTHFMTIGVARLADPSPAFDTGWYLEQNPDVAGLGANPLAHFLLQGQREGRWPRLPTADFASARPVTSARIACRKHPVPRPEIALFVTHSPDGGLRPHVRPYLEALAREGISIVLIVAADNGFTADEPWLYELANGVFVRENVGFDFAAWAHVLRLHRELYRADILYWLNDSLIGPISASAFHTLIERIRNTEADLIGLTDNYERGWHIQSYFLALKRNALRFYALHRFVSDILSFHNKDDVINTYEVKLAPALAAAGQTVTALFKAKSRSNPTIYHWRELLAEGFAFIKIQTIRDELPGADTTGWQAELDKREFDVTIAERVLAGETDGAGAGSEVRAQRGDAGVPVKPDEPRRVAFIGPWNFDNGLGVAARGYLSAFMHSGLQTNYSAIEPPFHIHHRATPTVHVRDFVGPADIAVVHLNPDGWDALLTAEQRAAVDGARMRVGAFIWESRKLPPEFHQLLPKVTAVWAPSHYCAEIFRSASNVRVHVVHFPVAVTPRCADRAEAAAVRQRLGLPADARIILFALDASSHLARKNPAALVAAFRASALATSNWHLVLKTKLSSENSSGTRALRQQVDNCPAASILDRPLDGEAMAALMAAADIYASPHSSEGFGLTIAEAMAMGKVVVATDYGGSRDFLDSETGFPVRYSEWQLDHDEGAYLKGTIWAKVDEDHLAASLVAAASLDGPARHAVGERARQRVQQLLSPEAVAAEIRGSIECLCNR